MTERQANSRKALGASVVCALALVVTFGVASLAARPGAAPATSTEGYERHGRLWARTVGDEGAAQRRVNQGLAQRGTLRVRPETASVTQGGAALDLVKTVGTDVNLCASTNSITVNNGALVTYCFDVTNTGAVTLSLHDLDDDQLGPILSSFSFDLGPGASVFITAATSVGPGDVTNTGTWTGSVIDGPTATDTDTATVTILGPAISLEKTVGTDVNLCAATNTISVVEGTQVTYCYRVENTGGFTLTVQDLIDDQLGVLLTSFPFALGPSQSAFLTASTVIGSASVTNTATWTGSNPPTSQLGGVTAESTDTATVEVVPVPVELQGFDVE